MKCKYRKNFYRVWENYAMCWPHQMFHHAMIQLLCTHPTSRYLNRIFRCLLKIRVESKLDANSIEAVNKTQKHTHTAMKPISWPTKSSVVVKSIDTIGESAYVFDHLDEWAHMAPVTNKWIIFQTHFFDFLQHYCLAIFDAVELIPRYIQ